MARKRTLCLEDLIAEINKVQEEISCTDSYEPSAVGMHNGLALAKCIAYRLATVGE